MEWAYANNSFIMLICTLEEQLVSIGTDMPPGLGISVVVTSPADVAFKSFTWPNFITIS